MNLSNFKPYVFFDNDINSITKNTWCVRDSKITSIDGLSKKQANKLLKELLK